MNIEFLPAWGKKKQNTVQVLQKLLNYDSEWDIFGLNTQNKIQTLISLVLALESMLALLL